MEFGSILKSIFSSEGSSAGAVSYIVDGESFSKQMGRGGSRGPASLTVLKKLAEFCQKEGITFTAVFQGKPLREVEDGGTFSGIRVFFIEKDQDFTRAVAEILRKRRSGGGALLITANKQLEEKALSQGAQTMRVATLLKAVDGNSSRNRPRRKPRSGKSSSNSPQKDRSRRKPRNEKDDGNDRGDDSHDDHILSLIDPL